ncbi:MAG: hypothetical protein ACI8T1_004955 [Verrucomicrobiales bacterium]|jgi:hypothetical protein
MTLWQDLRFVCEEMGDSFFQEALCFCRIRALIAASVWCSRKVFFDPIELSDDP